MARRFLVIGGAGFIGRHLVEELLGRGHDVRVLDSLLEQVHGPAATVPPELRDVELVVGDVRDASMLRRALTGIDGVFHLAAEVGVGQSMYEIGRYVSVNDYGTAVLLEALIEQPVARLVVASSMSVYGEGLYVSAEGARVEDAVRTPARMREGFWEPVTEGGEALYPTATDETKPVNLSSIYALTKYAQERSALIFGRAYDTDVVALRLFNVFGPGQALSNPYTGVLANFGARLMHRQRPLVFEDGAQRRDFVHVRDVARGFRLAMEEPEAAGEVINIGSGRPFPISEVASLLAAAMGRPELQPQILGKARAGDIRHCYADITKAQRLLGLEPRHQLEDQMPELTRWIQESGGIDRGEDARRELETLGLVS